MKKRYILELCFCYCQFPLRVFVLFWEGVASGQLNNSEKDRRKQAKSENAADSEALQMERTGRQGLSAVLLVTMRISWPGLTSSPYTAVLCGRGAELMKKKKCHRSGYFFTARSNWKATKQTKLHPKPMRLRWVLQCFEGWLTDEGQMNGDGSWQNCLLQKMRCFAFVLTGLFLGMVQTAKLTLKHHHSTPPTPPELKRKNVKASLSLTVACSQTKIQGTCVLFTSNKKKKRKMINYALVNLYALLKNIGLNFPI